MEKNKVFLEDIFQSRTLIHSLLGLDDDIRFLEEELNRTKIKNIELNKTISEGVFRQLDEGNKMMAETLKAIIDVPGIDSLGSVGVTMLTKIRNMKNVKEIHNYIDKIFKQVEK